MGGNKAQTVGYRYSLGLHLALCHGPIDAIREIRSTIGKLYGAEALPDSPRMYRTKSKNAQEAHEAIRPTSAARAPEQLAGKLDPDQHKLYTLIWRRAVASQMEAAVDWRANNPTPPPAPEPLSSSIPKAEWKEFSPREISCAPSKKTTPFLICR